MRTRVRAGEPSAFAELFDSYARTVYNHAYRLTADWSAAEDVMAATFMEAWRLRERVDPEGGSLRPWLLGIATNTARNHYRSDRRYRSAANAAAAAQLAEADHADEVADRVDDQRRLATALTVLAGLRRPEREVVALCLGEGLDYEAAAQALGIPVGTVASRLSRARRKLRALLDTDVASARRHAGRGHRDTGTEGRKVRVNREGGPVGRQTRDERTNAIRPAQEGTR